MTYNLLSISYYLSMRKVDVSTGRTNLADILNASRCGPVLVERYGKPAGVLISPARHDELLAALEELDDLRAFDDAMAEGGKNIPWDQVKADLGWS
jgi:PHD/YefM family antitoxin component YafN of YafNO toxin-antitoxin module